MSLEIADQYYLKAKSAISGFWSDWGEVCETLNYAISYDDKHCPSLTLLGGIYARRLNYFEEAFSCFDKVIDINPNYHEVYYEYITALVWHEELERAKKLIDFALTIKGVDKAQILRLKTNLLEVKQDYKAGIKVIKEAKKYAYNDYFRDCLDDDKKRLKAKLDELKPKKKSSKKKNSNKKKSKKKKK